jgi:uncharacterized protein (DUF934 family)
MSEQTEPVLWTRDGFMDDAWRHAGTLLEVGGKVILPLSAFLALDADAIGRHGGPIGVKLQPGEALDEIAGRLGELALVALVFPAFSDGRSFSKAALLRGRYGFPGAVRALGDVLIDQIPLMLRSGFTEFEVAHETTLVRLEAGRVGGIDQHYQPAAVDAARTGTYSWRRSSAA